MTEVNYKNTTIELSSIDGNWDYRTLFPDTRFADGLPISSIVFEPGGADTLVLRDGPIADLPPRFFKVTTYDSSDARKVDFYGMKKKVSLKYTDCTFSAGACVIINLDDRRMF